MGATNPLSQYAFNVSSQFGEDGILQKIFEILPDVSMWCVEFGAWDGKMGSNCYNLITNFKWNAVLIEASPFKFVALKKNYEENPRVYLVNQMVSYSGKDKLDNILTKTPLPKNFDLLSIDIDGNDYHVWEAFKEYSPKVVIIEFNQTIPSDIEFVQKKDLTVNQGSSILSICNLGRSKGYELIATTFCNAVFVKKEYFNLFDIKDNSLDVLWNIGFEVPRVFQLYDGTIVLSKEFDLFWKKIRVNRFDLQKIPKRSRYYIDAQKRRGLRKRLGRLYRRIRTFIGLPAFKQ